MWRNVDTSVVNWYDGSMLKGHKNTNQQGNAGVGVAIGCFATLGFTVSIPLNDSQDYDLIFDDGKLRKVQVKTTYYKNKYDRYQLSLTIKGGNNAKAGKIKRFDTAGVDFLFVVTETDKYLIPTSFLGKGLRTGLVLGDKYERFRLTEEWPSGLRRQP